MLEPAQVCYDAESDFWRLNSDGQVRRVRATLISIVATSDTQCRNQVVGARRHGSIMTSTPSTRGQFDVAVPHSTH